MRRVVFLFLLLAALSAALLGLRYLARDGFSARTRPGRIEAFLARNLRHLAIPASARSARNPVPLNDKVLAEARAHFADHCAICHANDGSGDTPIGRNLYPPAPDMRKEDTQELTDGELFYIIHNGIRFTGMPAWGEGPASADLASWKLVHFIRHLPYLTPDELAEMRRLNPKSAHEIEEEKAIEDFLSGRDDGAATPPGEGTSRQAPLE